MSCIQSIYKEEHSSGGSLLPISKAKENYPICQLPKSLDNIGESHNEMLLNSEAQDTTKSSQKLKGLLFWKDIY